jgi:hypothetical protein
MPAGTPGPAENDPEIEVAGISAAPVASSVGRITAVTRIISWDWPRTTGRERCGLTERHPLVPVDFRDTSHAVLRLAAENSVGRATES